MQIYIITYIIIVLVFAILFPVCLQFWHYIRHIYEKYGVHLQPETKHHIIYEGTDGSSPSAHQCLPCNESIITKYK